MCLKTNLKARKIDLKQEFIQQCKDILEDERLLSNLKQSKSLQKQNYNMQDLGTIEIIKLLKKKIRCQNRRFMSGMPTINLTRKSRYDV